MVVAKFFSETRVVAALALVTFVDTARAPSPPPQGGEGWGEEALLF